MYSKILRYFAYTIEIVIFYIIEQTPNLVPDINGIKPILIIPIVFMIALFEEEKVGLVFGLFVGILLDVGFSCNLGFFTIVIPIIGYIIGLVSKRVVKSNFSTAMIISAISVFLIFSLQFIFGYLIYGYGHIIYAYTFHYLPMMLYTLFSSVLFYFFNRAFALPVYKE